MIELKNVTFQYADAERGVCDVSLHVSKGKCVVLTGLSGCGKTTLTCLVNGLAPAYYQGSLSGEIRIDGRDIRKMKSWVIGQLVGSVFQDPKSQFFSSMMNGEVAFALENCGFSHAEIRGGPMTPSEGCDWIQSGIGRWMCSPAVKSSARRLPPSTLFSRRLSSATSRRPIWTRRVSKILRIRLRR